LMFNQAVKFSHLLPLVSYNESLEHFNVKKQRLNTRLEEMRIFDV
jgi:hypothetical protein